MRLNSGTCAAQRGALWLVVSLAARTALAEPPDAETFAPPAGEAALFATAEPEVLPHLAVSAALSSSYARRPLVRRVSCAGPAGDLSCVAGEGESPLVRDLIQTEAAVALGLFDVAQLGVVAPFVWSRRADDFELPARLESGASFGDLRVDLDATLLRGPFASGVRLVTSLPTGDAAIAHGGSGPAFTPSLVARGRIAALSVAGSLGYRVQRRARVPGARHDDALEATLGVGVALSRALELRAEAHGRFGTTAWVEALTGVAIAPAQSVELLAALGGALPPSAIGEGAAALRAYLAARASFGADARGPVGPDVDHDGLDNARDACALVPEDRDGFADDDGCPDLDDDADGLRDDVDRCPKQSEDRDGFEDDDGCPELDNDRDGQPDGSDACSMDPEDRDGFEDGDGCPEPGPKPVTVSIEEGRILVSERIYFAGDSDVLRAVSFPALDRIAEAIRGLPAGRVVRVEGHTDASGNTAYDLDVSYRRARAVVEYLKSKGVPAERLKHRGYGATKPIADGDTPDVRALNRRVELVLE